ncbi:hypothetical protein Calkro_2152 [Caldicellulosiruptor kronotskyensis 2002]|uniref:Uncharacterized protein n=1 Tax=Caldicellulosiruptor kronotskyensis (strain DSM 18902 / VKM B-2412 / 2002) TaxID=632348 RepID=E4SGW8_CALK2|nr:hypothetical protein [Caldicellulosiruptor kronotskyensis]ADQ46993.1 hypothetical protein Calkro_2152 [Caldicellulosiruptor kronotskyensis 2002]
MNKKLIYKLAFLSIILALILAVICWNYFNIKERFANSSKAAKYEFFCSIKDTYFNALYFMENLKKNNKLTFSQEFLYLRDSLTSSARLLVILRNTNPRYRKYESKVPSILYTVNDINSLIGQIYFNLSEGKPITTNDSNKLKFLTNEDIYNMLSNYCSLIKNIISENGEIIESDKALHNPDKYFDKMLEKWDLKKAELLFHKGLKADITDWP